MQESITHLQSDYKGLEKRVSDIEKVQASSDCERNNAIAIEKLQREMVQMQNELKKPEYNHNEAETYKAHIETERNEAAKAQDTLAKVTEKYEAQIKAKDEINKHLQLKNESISNQLLQSLAENKRQKELQSALQNELSHEKEKSETNQSTIKRLKDETDLLKTAKTESDSQLLEYTKKFENQLQIENELRDATKAKKAILQELAESKKQYDTLKEMFDKVKIENHDKEAMIRNLQFALDKVKQQLHAEKSIKVNVCYHKITLFVH